jgi:hypothetical protein
MAHQISRPVKMKKRIPFFAFLLFYLVFSVVTFRDYGSTWDEQDTYQGGTELYQYLIHGQPMSYMDPEHSYPYTFFLHFITGPANYETLHLLNLFFGAFLFWALFEALLSAYSSSLWALSGPVFLFLLLPFLGSIPANPKDIPFAVFYFLSLAVIYLFERVFPRLKFRWFFLGLLFGIANSSRIVGFTLFPILLFYDAFLYWGAKRKKKRNENKKWFKKKILEWTGTLAVSQVLCMILWPFVGQDYFKNMPLVFWLSARFPPKFSFLFMGGMADSLTYPWYYLPVWISITTPLFILSFFLGSFFFFKAVKTNALYLLMGTAFALNIGLYFLLHPAVYDGLRHFLYLLPLIAALAAMAFIEFFRKAKWGAGRKAAAGLTLVGALMTTADLIRLHPYEYTYFNELVGGLKGAYGKFETDYWVASMKEAVQWLKANETKEPNQTYKIYADGKPFRCEAYFTPNMVRVPQKEQADYAIIMTRAGIKPAPEEEGKIIHRVEREGAPLCFILKMR